MKLKAMILVSMILASGLFVGTIAQAAPYTATIVFMDNSSNVQDYFEQFEYVYFEVTVRDNGTYLQFEWIDVVIIRESDSSEVMNNTYDTNEYGRITGSYYANTVGLYIMFVNYSGTLVASDTFRVYVPVPSTATVWTEYYGEVTDSFTEDQRVEVNVLVLDNYGNPFDSYTGEVYYRITKGGDQVDSKNLNTNSAGEDMEYFYPSTQDVSQFGTYMVTVYNDASDAIGFFNFTVYLPDRAVVQPQYWGEDRNLFKAGETVGYDIQLYYKSTIPYDSDTYAARVTLYKIDTGEELENRTLNTDQYGEASAWNFYNIGNSDDSKGQYSIRVYNRAWALIGSADFMVVDLEITMQPDKYVFAQGDRVTIGVTTSLTQAYNVLIINDAENLIAAAASWSVPAGTSSWTKEYTFPDVSDGTYYVEVRTGNLFLDSREFELKKFTVEVTLDQQAFVPGQQGVFFWRAINNHDGSPYAISGDTSLQYYDDAFNLDTEPLSAISGTYGRQTFKVPKEAMQGMEAYLEVEARDTSDHTDDAGAMLRVGSLRVGVDTDRGTYRPGETVYLTLTSSVQSYGSPVPQVEIEMTMQYNGVDQGSTRTLTTDSFGTVYATYTIPSNAGQGTWIIDIEATFVPNDQVTHETSSSFMVSTDPVMAMYLYPEKSLYSPGDSISIPYKVFEDGNEITDSEVSFIAGIGSTSTNIVAMGFGDSGLIEFNLPADAEGQLRVQAIAITPDGYQASTTISSIYVTRGQLLLFVEKSAYLPGENITWFYTLYGDTEAQASYRITDQNGLLLAEGSPIDGKFHYLLPEGQRGDVTAMLVVIGSAKTHTATALAELFTGMVIDWELSKNSYAPGDTIKINYKIRKIGEVPDFPEGFNLQIMVYGLPVLFITVTELNGTISYQLPKEMDDGKYIVAVIMDSYGNPFNDLKVVIVDSKAGELAHGTILGMNAGAFVVLIFALLALILAIIGLMKLRKIAKPDFEEPEEPEMPEEPQYDSYQTERAQAYESQPPQEPVAPANPEQGYYPPPPPTEPVPGDYPPPPQE